MTLPVLPFSVSLEAALSVGLLGVLLLLSARLGRWVGLHLHLWPPDEPEEALWTIPLGMGVLAYGILGLGLLGWFCREAFLLWLVGVLLWTRGMGWGGLEKILPAMRNGWRYLRPRRVVLLYIVLLTGLGTFTFLQALTPPWGYDALMYHLEGPWRFLEQRRLVLLPDIWQANGPFTVQMLFALGLSLGLSIFAKLVHFLYALLLLLATFILGRRYGGGPTVGALAAGILVGMPVFPLWAALAQVDLAWALYELLALYAVFRWHDEAHARWLVLGGIMMGLALGTKYLALAGGAVLGAWVLWSSRHEGRRGLLRNALSFGGTALALALPWYLKNAVWGGNPFYPLLWGGVAWPPERLHALNTYLHSFGMGTGLKDLLLLPWHIYAHHERFGTFLGTVEIPSLLFPLIALYIWTPKSPWMNRLGLIIAARGLFWFWGSQQVRFLLPVLPLLSVWTAYVLQNLVRQRRLRRVLQHGLVGGMVAATFAYAILFQLQVQPWRVLGGWESRHAWLTRLVTSYAAQQYIVQHFPPEARVLQMWDGQSFYCDARCLPDAEHSRWNRIVDSGTNSIAVCDRLRAQKITHLLLNRVDLAFQMRLDLTGRHARAYTFFVETFQPCCTREVYQDDWVSLYELTCPAARP